MALSPLYDQVFLRRLDPPPAPSGFLIPDASKERALECAVVAVGPAYQNDRGVWMVPPVTAGQKVLLGKYSGSEYKLRQDDGSVVEVTIVRWEQLLGAEPAGMSCSGVIEVPKEVFAELKRIHESQEKVSGADPAFFDHHPHLGTTHSRHDARLSPTVPRRNVPAPRPDIDTDPSPDAAADQYARDFAGQLARKGQQQ